MMPKIFVNGEELTVTEGEYNQMYPPLTDKERLRKEASVNISSAPTNGFGGPKAKELFNGNR